MKIAIRPYPSFVSDALIVSALPEPGQMFGGYIIAAVEPHPLYCEQPSPDVYAWSVWRLRFADCSAEAFVAIHEPESETI